MRSIHSRSMVGVIATAAFLVAAAGASATPGPLEVIYTKIVTQPNSIVPGALDLAGAPAVTNFRALEDLIMSPDGSKWVIKARTQQGADSETILLMGSGTVGTMFAQEGRPIVGGAPGELYDFFGSAIGSGRFNTLNEFAFSARARGGVASVFQKVIRWTGGSNFTIPFAMGSAIGGLQDSPVGNSGDEIFGNSVGSIHLLDNGDIGSQDSTIGNISSTRRPAIMYNQEAFHQANVTTITARGGVGIEIWKSIDANSFYSSADGAHWIATGTVNQPTATDAVLVVDGKVIFQEGFNIPSTPVVFAGTFNADIRSNGDWYARGDDASANDWAVRNGVLLAKTGDPITTSSGGENWGNSFLALTINRVGDWVLCGNTSSANPAADNVVVLNGTDVIVREGDPVDLDGNGLFDDDAFIGRGTNTLSAFEPNDFYLTDDKVLYFFADLRNGAGQDLNSTPAFGTPQAFLRIDLAPPPPCPADFNNDGIIGTADLTFLLGQFGATVPPGTGADINGDGIVGTADLTALLGAFGSNCS